MGYIYSITNEKNQELYVGKTIKTVEQRLQRHFYLSRCNSNTHLHKSIKKHGEESFTIQVIAEVDDHLLDDMEKHYIEQLKPHYNMTLGGDGGDTSKSDNYKKAIERRDMSGKNNPMFGKKGVDNPNFGKKRGSTPKITKALSNPCVCEDRQFSSITEAELFYKGKCSVRKRLDNPKYPDWYRLVPKTKRK